MKKSLPLIWLPGLLCDGTLFEDVDQCLPEWIAPACFTLDALPTMEQLAADVLAKAPKEFVLGGLSMGGILAFEVYRQAPHRVKGLILMDTNSANEKNEVSEKRNALVSRALNGEFEQITPEVLMPLLIHPSRLEESDLTGKIEQMAINIGLEAFQAHANALATRPDARPFLSEISVPTIVLTGKNDLLCPIDNHLLMAQHIPDVTMHVLPNCGHLSSLEQPEAVALRLSNWLDLYQSQWL
ncbi:alpha/beta fold hydrolase [Vibrio caribbeanicus]|uniref:alpha/beta fold hydrolase n=1 Tax=Vibrio caribbeanicus TaxID=701175 RepID=UPI0030D6FB54